MKPAVCQFSAFSNALNSRYLPFKAKGGATLITTKNTLTLPFVLDRLLQLEAGHLSLLSRRPGGKDENTEGFNILPNFKDSQWDF